MPNTVFYASQLTKRDVDKLVMHIAALALIVDGYETDVFDLREDLRLETKQYVKLRRLPFLYFIDCQHVLI